MNDTERLWEQRLGRLNDIVQYLPNCSRDVGTVEGEVIGRYAHISKDDEGFTVHTSDDLPGERFPSWDFHASYSLESGERVE